MQTKMYLLIENPVKVKTLPLIFYPPDIWQPNNLVMFKYHVLDYKTVADYFF